MLQNEKNRPFKQKHLILFAPLDWGWGHTTRCIPLMKYFQDLGCDILVACNSTQKNLIEREIYGVRFIPLEGYNIEYGRSGLGTKAKIFSQLNKILMKVNQERRWLKAFLDQEAVQLVISDNRYGFCDPRTTCIFITHQLQPRSGLGKLADIALRSFLYRYINRFSEVWVPDNATSSLAGSLSAPAKLPGVPVNYIGPVSRITRAEKKEADALQLLIVLSGPEPQRSLFESEILKQLKDQNIKLHSCTLVRGVNAQEIIQQPVPAFLTVIDKADSGTLSQLISKAEIVLTRSGYTSLMEMVACGKKMILVPTPGQTEQEYLANYFSSKNYAVSYTQSQFSLSTAIKAALSKDVTLPQLNMHAYKNAVQTALNKITV